MAREHLIGGIYGRPVAMGNFLHFFVAAVGLSEQLLTGPMQIVLAGVTAAYILFAVGFSYVLFAGGQSCG